MEKELNNGIKEDLINHPNHYANSCSLECIEAMELFYGLKAVFDFCKLNAFKYIWRYKNKNGEEDLQKAKWYCGKGYYFLSKLRSEGQITEQELESERQELQNLRDFINHKLKIERIKEISEEEEKALKE